MKLKEFLNLDEKQLNKTRIGLNMSWNGISHFSRWYNSDSSNRDVSYNYSPYFADKRNYQEGDLSFGFVRLPNDNDLWLFVTAGEIVSVPDKSVDEKCKYNVIEKFKPYFGRLIIKYHKGQTYDRYIFKKKSILEDAEVVNILRNDYEEKNPKLINKKVVLQPYGEADDEEHFINSINKPRKIDEFIGFCSDEEIEFLKRTYPSDGVCVWGILPGEKNEPSWNSINAGDIVLFNRNKSYFASCEVTYKTHNKKLAESIFGPCINGDKKGQFYEYIYFFNNICFFDVPNSTLNRVVGYKEGNNVQGFQVLDDEKSYKVLSTFDVSIVTENQEDNNSLKENQEITDIELIDSVKIKDRETKKSTKKNYNSNPDFNQINKNKSASGLRAEQKVLEFEKKNNPKYADQIIRVGDYPAYGYDIKSFDKEGNEKHIEVKNCSQGSENKVDFYLTINERKQMELDPQYCIYYVCGKNKKKIFVLNKSNLESVSLASVVFKITAKVVEEE